MNERAGPDLIDFLVDNRLTVSIALERFGQQKLAAM